MATARHAMLAVLRGRFDEAGRLIGDVADGGRRAGMADAWAITATLTASVAAERGPNAFLEAGGGSRCWPGQRRCPVTSTRRRRRGYSCFSTGPRTPPWSSSGFFPGRWPARDPGGSGAMTDLAVAAAAVGDTAAAAQIHAALVPYRGRLVVWGGAATAWGPVSHYLGLLAAVLGKAGNAVGYFKEAVDFERANRRPAVLGARLCGLADAVACARMEAGDASMAAEASPSRP